MGAEPTPQADEITILKNQEEIKALLNQIITSVQELLHKIG